MSDVKINKAESDLAFQVNDARESKTPLRIEGGGTKLDIGRPIQSARAIFTTPLNGITLYEPSEMVISALAGTPLRDVENTLAEKGQMLPFEPSDYRALLGKAGEPTIGGITAANISGSRRISVGACRDSLIGIRMLNGRGEMIKSGGRVMKNVTGLDLAKLACGAWGTLGILTETTFKILPKPETMTTLVFYGLDDTRAIEAMSLAMTSPFDITGAAHIPQGVERVAMTLLRLEGFHPSVEYRATQLKTLLQKFGPADRHDPDASSALWRRIRNAEAFVEPREDAIWRISIAPSKSVPFLQRLAMVLSFRHVFDWGGGLIYLQCATGDDAGALQIRNELRGTGGHATLLRAPQTVRAAVDVFEPEHPAIRKLSDDVRASFDPARIFNPGLMTTGV